MSAAGGCICILSTILLLDVKIVGLGKAVLKEGRRTGPFESTEATLARFAGVGGESRDAR